MMADINQYPLFESMNYCVKEICRKYNFKKTLDKVPIRKIIVANIEIPEEISTEHEQLKDEFSQFGEIDDCILKKKSGNRKSYAFITFCETEGAESALEAAYNSHITINGQNLRVIPAVPWHQPDRIYNNEYYAFDAFDGVKINELNNDCFAHIFIQLSFIERLRLEAVCKRWYMASRESWPFQRQLDLSLSTWGIKTINAPMLQRILSRCGPHLTDIDLSENCDNLGNATLIAVAKSCPNIKSINIGFVVKATGIEALAKYCKKILNFTLCTKSRYNSNVEKELAHLFSSNQRIKCLTLDCSAFNGEIETLLKLSTKSIEEMSLFHFDFSHPETDLLPKIYKKFQNLHTLNLSHYSCNTVDEKLHSILELSTLIEKLKNLKIFTLNYSNYLGDKFFIELREKCQQIYKVDISYCDSLTDAAVAKITSLPKLEYLNISNNINITDNVFICMENIKILDCSYCLNMGDDGIISLLRISRNIEIINLSGCPNITDQVVDVAKEVTIYRRDKILKIYVKGTAINEAININVMTAFLEIWNTSPTYSPPYEWKKEGLWTRFHDELYS